jgi:GntR family transcriptional regulator/MocR family aminotransferase
LYKHIKNIVEVGQERQALFLSEFNKSKTMKIEKTEFSSFHLVAKFNTKITEKEELEIIEKLAKAQITAHSLSKCFIGSQKGQGLILGFSSVRPNVLLEKVKKLVSTIG